METRGKLLPSCPMKPLVRAAFLAVRENCSPDVVVADPGLNEKFIAACREAGLTEPALVLNEKLLNMRKAKDLQGISRSRRRVLKNQDEYRFASEMAVRFLERRDGISLDKVLCDPGRAAEFDQLAASISPGFSAFEYRWAALNLRKRRKLRPELLSRVVSAQQVFRSKIAELRLDTMPVTQGLYLFFHSEELLYVGECENLRKRIAKHLEHSDNRGLARWLWQHGTDDLHIEYHVLPDATPTRVRKALEAEMIVSRRPLFNVGGI
jgi:hypothetical protein